MRLLEARSMYVDDLPSIEGNAKVECVRRVPLGLCGRERQCWWTSHNKTRN